MKNYGKAFQLDYTTTASARRETGETPRTYGPFLAIVSAHDQSDEGSHIPAASIYLTGRDSLLALRDAIDEALAKDEA